MLTPGQLAAMQATVQASLPDVAIHLRPSRTADGAGGESIHWDVVTTCPVRVSPQQVLWGAGEREAAARLTMETQWRLTVPAGQDVRIDDRLVVNARTFDVIMVRARSHEVARALICVEMT